jgi:hypothetical protein
MRQFRNVTLWSVLGGLVAVIALAVAMTIVADNIRDSDQGLSRRIVAAQIANCLHGAEPAVAQLNFDYGVYRADFASASDPTVSSAERHTRLIEARFLLAEARIRAQRVPVTALAFTGAYRLIDPTLRSVVARMHVRCAAEYP